MNVSLSKQILHESDSWKRSLEFIEIENNFLLNRLADVLKESPDFESLNGAETYHERLIYITGLLKLSQQHVTELDQLLLKEKYENGKVARQIDLAYKEVKKEIGQVEEQFNKLKSEFNNFLGEIL